MASKATVTILGYLGQTPELRFTQQGDAVTNLSVAVTEKGRNDEVTTWFKVNVWNKAAEACCQYLTKGSQVYVTGSIKLEKWSNERGEGVNLVVDRADVTFVRTDKNASDNEGGNNVASAPKANNNSSDADKGDDEEIPF